LFTGLIDAITALGVSWGPSHPGLTVSRKTGPKTTQLRLQGWCSQPLQWILSVASILVPGVVRNLLVSNCYFYY
jgi:hypothetical protein